MPDCGYESLATCMGGCNRRLCGEEFPRLPGDDFRGILFYFRLIDAVTNDRLDSNPNPKATGQETEYGLNRYETRVESHRACAYRRRSVEGVVERRAEGASDLRQLLDPRGEAPIDSDLAPETLQAREPNAA